jgi:hypothetical protein
MTVSQREEVQAFLRATSGLAWKVYQTMPADWTPATEVLPRLKQSSRSTALGVLRRAGAVETKRQGKVVLYRPKPHFYVRALANRQPEAA